MTKPKREQTQAMIAEAEKSMELRMPKHSGGKVVRRETGRSTMLGIEYPAGTQWMRRWGVEG